MLDLTKLYPFLDEESVYVVVVIGETSECVLVVDMPDLGDQPLEAWLDVNWDEWYCNGANWKIELDSSDMMCEDWARRVARQWPMARVMFTPCSCCSGYHDYRESYPSWNIPAIVSLPLFP